MDGSGTEAQPSTPQRSASQGNRVLPTAASVQSVAGLVAVVVGVLAVTALAIATMAFVDSGRDANTLIPLSTAAFGVISAVVGAYLGIKIGTDQSKTLVQEVTQTHARLAAVQSFVPADQQQEAQRAGQHAAETAGPASRHPHTG